MAILEDFLNGVNQAWSLYKTADRRIVFHPFWSKFTGLGIGFRSPGLDKSSERPNESILQNEKALTNKNNLFTPEVYTLDAICEHVGGLWRENYKAWLAVIF